MSAIFNVSRRRFLQTSALAGGGLILGMHLPGFARASDAVAKGESGSSIPLNAFVRVAKDGSVTVIVNHSEMGQGPYTTIPMLVADEMDADWKKVHYEAAPVDAIYNHTVYGIQMTGGSSSTWSEYERVRKAGATAKAMLIAAAAEMWQVKPENCRAENGEIINTDTGKRLSFGALAEKASHLTPPKDVKLKEPKNFKLIGKATKRLDTPDKTNGRAIFGIDIAVPGMLVAVIARSPVFGGKVKSFNADKAKTMPGVKHVVQIDRGVAVVADGYWRAKQARDALAIDWDLGALANLDSKTQGQAYAQLAEKRGAVARNDGDAGAALGSSAKRIDAVYELPYLAHATMEPMNCVADVRADSAEIWTGTQFQTVDRNTAAAVLGFKPEQVKLNTTLLGGGFGRRAVPDSHMVVEAVQVSKAIGKPVKVIWSREDDTQGGYYRPRAYHKISGAIGDDGQPSAWQHRIVCQSFVIGTPFEKMIIKDGVDGTAVEGAKDVPYAIANVQVDWQMAPGGVPCIWLRSVGHSHNAFVVEGFIDELAHAAGKDPYEYRLALLEKQPRHKRLLELVASKAGWGKPLPEGHGRGIAVHESFGSLAAHVIEASVSDKHVVKVHRVVCAIDCGQAVNPSNIRAQLQSGAVFGLTAALYGQITFAKGRVVQSNFYDYPMLRMNEMPIVEAFIVPSTEKMGGVGEPAVPSVAPALANAIFAATGKRIRRLPIHTEDLKTS